MLSIKSISASDAGDMAKYYQDLAGKDDYYSKESGESEPAGYWLGGCAEALNLHGEVQPGQLLAALTGHDPSTGEALAKNAGDDHKPGWDCTYSAPKSVSAAWAIADPKMREKIETAHRAAVETSIEYLEQNAACTRHGHGGEVKIPASDNGGLLVAVYQHSTSRNQDPQLHSHCLVSNLNKDGRGIDLDTSYKMAAGALYRVELAHQLKEIGFEIERDDKSFKLAGVPEKLVDEWSSRRAQIEERLAERGESGALASQDAALKTRDKKEAVSQESLLGKWAEQAKAHDFTPERIRELSDPSKRQEKARELPKPDKDIVADLTVQNATFTRLQALHQVAIDGQGKLSAAQTLERADRVLKESDAVSLGTVTRKEAEASNMKSGDRYTTTEMLKIEQKMLETAFSMGQKSGFAVDGEKVHQCAKEKGLSEQQTRALEHITAASSAAVLEGWAGAGKSYLLGAARESWEAAGYEVRGVALANAAAQNLEKEAGIASTSIAKLQHDIEKGDVQLSSRTVLVLDEAGMVGTRQMQSLFEKAELAGAKIVLAGDTKQLQSIDAGAAMRAISEQIGKAELSEVRRQTHQIDREIARDFREGRAGEALEKLDKLDRLHVGKDMHEARTEAVKAFMADRAEGKTSLLIAATREEVRQLNGEVRAELQAAGKVDRDGITTKTSTGYREFSQGDQVVFGERFMFGPKGDQDRTVVNGSTGQVLSAMKEDGKASLLVQLDKSGEVVRVDLDKMNKVDHGYCTTVHKSQGATVETAHVLAGERTGQEWAYVAGSRQKEGVSIYTSRDHYQRPEPGKVDEKSDLEKGMSQSQAKDLATDYTKGSSEVDGPEMR